MKTNTRRAIGRRAFGCRLVSLSLAVLAGSLDWRDARAAEVQGELRCWHEVTVSFAGPASSEDAAANPFRDYRLNVAFTHPESGDSYPAVPGYFAADGRAGESEAKAGSVWRVHFAPPRAGTWHYRASLRSGKDVAVSLEAEAGAPVELPEASGTFVVAPSDKQSPDNRGRGLLQFRGGRYPTFAGNGETFLKGGSNSPENLLAFADFDATRPSHKYAAHLPDWRAEDPTWRGGRGKAIIGAVNYLAGQGVNAQYFLTQNVGGDGDDVWPWIDRDIHDRFDCSKLDQWNIVFTHMQRRGIAMHVVLNEQECDQLLDGGELGVERKLYFRELVARFAHHPALIWNLGEESTNTFRQHAAFIEYLRAIDPYDHPVVMHSFPGHYDRVYEPLLGNPGFSGASLQLGDPRFVHSETIKWLDRSLAAGHPWWVCCDEIGPARDGLVPDAVDAGHDHVRHRLLWGNLMAGGGGVEYYFGWGHPQHDRSVEDFRSRENMWRQTRIALEFFRSHVPYTRMRHNDGLTSSREDFCLAEPGRTYLVYLPAGGKTEIDLGGSQERFTVAWFNPREGGSLQPAGLIRGPGWATVGAPPAEEAKDWVLLLRRSDYGDLPATGRVTGLTLIDCRTKQPIEGFDPIRSGATLDLGRLPPRVSLRAETEPAQVGSVQFRINGTASRPDSTAPFAFPTDVNGEYDLPWKVTPGKYTLTATPFAQGAGDGEVGAEHSVTIEVIGKRPD
jgi:hypothetical protein